MASSTDQTAFSSNPFRRKTRSNLGIDSDISSPASPSVHGLGLFNNADSGPSPRSPFDPRTDTTTSLDAASQPPIPKQPFTTFRSSANDSDAPASGDDTVHVRPKKIIKKVRVQSPPPSSPEEALPVNKSDSYDYGFDDDYNEDAQSDVSASERPRVDPFGTRSQTFDNGERSKPAAIAGGPPSNPFSRTLQDIEKGDRPEDVSTQAGSSKTAMDVNSFKNLLLTGYSNLPAVGKTIQTSAVSSATAAPRIHDGASNTDASSTSRQSIFDQIQDAPRTSHDTSDPEGVERAIPAVPSSRLASSIQSAPNRKKPPPPSSRHGKLIRVELGTDSRTSTPESGNSAVQLQPPNSDVNKPLPSPPNRSPYDEAIESPFDREAAGKVPEASEDQSGPNSPSGRNRSDSQSSTQSKRPSIPPQAPPPRRHARSESRVVQRQSGTAEEDPPRSSLESTRSRTESIRGVGSSGNGTVVPAPPPPRRPHHGRSGSSYSFVNQPGISSPQPATFSTEGSLPLAPKSKRPSLDSASSSSIRVETSREGTTKLNAPPPPPARHSSTRRPASSSKNMEGGSTLSSSRRSNRDSIIAPPPPPPPRQRGSSRGSMESYTRPTLKDVEPHNSRVTPTAPTPTHGAEILADLNELQREVDALMNKAKAG